MKKFLISLFACLACLYSHEAIGALPDFAESGRIITAIVEATEDPEFSDLFKANEFIVDITKRTAGITGKIKYNLVTCVLNDADNCRKFKNYIVTVRVRPNPDIGPNEVTVLRIRKVDSFR